MSITAALRKNDHLRTLYDRVRRALKKQNRDMHKIERISTGDGISLIRNRVSGASAFFPYADYSQFNRTQLFILLNGFDRHMVKKYFDGPFRVREGDTVIDCGGFVGGFTLAASRAGAAHIHYVEPTPMSRRCAALNFALHGVENVSVHPCALGETPGEAVLNLSLSGADNSLIDPDEGATNETITVDVRTPARCRDSCRERHGWGRRRHS